MYKIVVLIPTHIYYDKQILLLERCLDSIINQTYKINIYVSISYEYDTYKDKVLNLIHNKFENKITFIFNSNKLYQMEHLYNLFNIIKNKYDLIMFCDDDDYYLKERVENFYICYSEHNKSVCAGIREIYTNPSPIEIYEYWQYGLTNKTLEDFFNVFEIFKKLDLFKHKFADMYLSCYLKCSQINHVYINMIFNKNTPVYIHDENNKYSICNNIANNDLLQQNKDNLLLNIITNYPPIKNYNQFCESKWYKLYAHMEESNCKELKSIYTFCNILYNS